MNKSWKSPPDLRMLGHYRILAYGIAIVLSTFLSILTTYDRVDKDAHKDRLMPMLRVSSLEELNPPSVKSVARKIAPQPVIAPWTKLIEKPGKHTLPRSFVFAEVDRLTDYGLMLRRFDETQRQEIRQQMKDRLCHRSRKFAATMYDANKCNLGVVLWKCTTCSELDGSWYLANSVTGAVFGKAESDSTVRFPFYNDGPFVYQQLDIAVPIAGQDEKLRLFAKNLGPSVTKFRQGLQGSRIAIRLLITKFRNEAFESEEAMIDFRNVLIKETALDRPGDSVEFVTVEETSFNRAKAVNALHAAACHNDNCVLACTDVDMDISSRFLRNALIFPFPGAAAYFPIMWSQFNPETVEAVDKFFPDSANWKFTDHHVSIEAFEYRLPPVLKRMN